MANVTVAELADALRRHELLEPAQLDGLTSPFLARFADANDLARELLQRGWLTAYQVELLLQGRGDELVLGAYQLLDRLGEDRVAKELGAFDDTGFRQRLHQRESCRWDVIELQHLFGATLVKGQ